MGYVPVSDKNLSFDLTQKLSKSPKNVGSSCYLSIIFENIGMLDRSKHSDVIETGM